MDGDCDDLATAAVGVVPVAGRGSLPFLLVHGESLVAAASWALEAAGIPLADLPAGPEELRASGRAVVVHDPLCPMTPPAFLAEAARQCLRDGVVVVGARPVTDTIKEFDGRLLGATHDRDELVGVVSPVVLPASVLAGLRELPADLDALVDDLARRAPVRLLQAPAAAARVLSAEDVVVLEALTG